MQPHAMSSDTGLPAQTKAWKKRAGSMNDMLVGAALGGRIRYLVDTPEMIWGCLDTERLLDGALRLLRAREVHRRLRSGRRGAEVAARFPLLVPLWPGVDKFRCAAGSDLVVHGAYHQRVQAARAVRLRVHASTFVGMPCALGARAPRWGRASCCLSRGLAYTTTGALPALEPSFVVIRRSSCALPDVRAALARHGQVPVRSRPWGDLIRDACPAGFTCKQGGLCRCIHTIYN